MLLCSFHSYHTYNHCCWRCDGKIKWKSGNIWPAAGKFGQRYSPASGKGSLQGAADARVLTSLHTSVLSGITCIHHMYVVLSVNWHTPFSSAFLGCDTTASPHQSTWPQDVRFQASWSLVRTLQVMKVTNIQRPTNKSKKNKTNPNNNNKKQTKKSPSISHSAHS